ILPSNTIDVSTPALINDLDIRITKSTNLFFPWKLNPANPSAAAVNEDNIVDNVEKIEINNPTGSYTITITHKGNLQNLIQNYSLVISGVTVKDFWMTSDQNLNSICQGTDSTDFFLNLHTKSNFSDTVVFSALNLPTGITAVFSPSSMTTNGPFDVNFSGLSSLPPGEYEIIIRGESENEFNDFPLSIIIYSPDLSSLNLQSPLNLSEGISATNPVLFEWENIPNAQEYLIEIANDNLFNNIILSEVVSINEFSASDLFNSTVYYWRVKPINLCGEGLFSSVFSFTTSCSLSMTNLMQVGATTTSATIQWTDNNSTNWEIEIVPEGSAATGSGTVISTNPFVISQLLPNTCYTIYVRSLCLVGFTEWLSVDVCTQPDYCGGNAFYDTGGANGNYQNNENWTETIYPQDADHRIRAIFNSYAVESCCDFLRIYNGPNSTFPILFNGGFVSPGTIVSTHATGALTFSFTSDSSVTASGWNATIICEETPACAVPPSNLILTGATDNSLTVSWIENSNATSWEIEITPLNTTPTGNGMMVSSNVFTFVDLPTLTCFDIYIRSLCAEGGSEWITIEACTQANYCGGDLFYDTGGANGNYQNNENWTETIYPQDADHRIRAIFNSYAVESCCDFLRIYNGPNTTFPLLFNGGSASPGTLVSTHPTGALTFRFTSDGSVTASGWNATIICEEMPACALAPSNLILNGATNNSLSVSWIENNNATSWEIEIVPLNATPTGNGTVVSSNVFTFLNLPTLTCFDIYVRSLCEGGGSEWITIEACTQANYCGGDLFYDTGGANGNYQNNENWTETIYPQDADHRIRAIFNSYAVESCCDFLRIYNGPNTTFPLLFNGGSASPGTLVSTHPTGALTFRFTSDGSVTASGWNATIICEETPACAIPPSNLVLTGATASSLSVSWIENSNATSWEIEIVPLNATPTGNGIVMSSNPFTFSNLPSLTCFDIYLRSLCNDGGSDWITIEGCTTVNYCGGDLFYDTGGANGNYQNNENWTETIYPQDSNHHIRAVFNSYAVESCCDFLRIYNGPNTSFPLLFNGGNTSPGTVVSTHPTGALTFRFTSDFSVTASGWNATIICEETLSIENPETIELLKFYPNPVSNELKIESQVIINNYKIYDHLGRLISSKNVSLDIFYIPFDVYASGSYIIILEDNDAQIKNISVIKR
uniref:T9SS type A sorting domain-containing protein n=1 Tax=Flavobacterium sp. TaxID=239 RepID=UPI004048F02D